MTSYGRVHQAMLNRCAERARTAADHPTWSVAYAEDVPMLLAEIEFLQRFVFQKCEQCGLVTAPITDHIGESE